MFRVHLTDTGSTNRTIIGVDKIVSNIVKQSIAQKRSLANKIKQKAITNINQRSRFHGETPGRLAGSIFLQLPAKGATKSVTGIVVSAPYAVYVEKGTKPHLVYSPRFGRGWRGPDHGKSFAETAGYYMHPGSKPMWFMRDAIKGAAKELRDRIEKTVKTNVQR